MVQEMQLPTSLILKVGVAHLPMMLTYTTECTDCQLMKLEANLFHAKSHTSHYSTNGKYEDNMENTWHAPAQVEANVMNVDF